MRDENRSPYECTILKWLKLLDYESQIIPIDEWNGLFQQQIKYSIFSHFYKQNKNPRLLGDFLTNDLNGIGRREYRENIYEVNFIVQIETVKQRR